jgi:DNA ligase-1
LEKIKQICDELQATNGKIDKEKILLREKDNEPFKKVIYFLLNPFIISGLSDKKINKISVKTSSWEHDSSTEELLNLLNYIKENNTGKDENIIMCHSWMCSLNNELQEFVKSLLTKSLKLGISEKTVNKCWGKDFIPTFECMLAEKYFEHSDKVEGKDFSITLKLDGIRCLAVKENGKVKLFSRQGQVIEGLVDIEKSIEENNVDNIVLDGELLISDVSNILSKDQYKATSKIVRKDGIKKGITYRVFDCMTEKHFKTQTCDIPYSQRRILLQMFEKLDYIEVLPVLYSGNDTSQIITILDKVRAEGQEGIMLNLNDSPYEFKRTRNLLKCKVMQDCDLEIIGFEEGQGRLSGTLGRINVDYKGNKLGVGGGFSDADRKYFWENQTDLLGRVITVQFFEETEDKDGKKSLRFPVFKELRELGKEVSYF